MGFFDKVKDVLTTSDAERARSAQARDASDQTGASPSPPPVEAPRTDGAAVRPAEVRDASGATHDDSSAGAGTASYRTHTVRHGDTLASIAEHYGVDPGAMAELNRIDNPDLIYPAQVLRVPPA